MTWGFSAFFLAGMENVSGFEMATFSNRGITWNPSQVHPFNVDDVSDEHSTQVRRNGYYIWILLLE